MLPSAFQTPRTAATHDNANHGLDGSNYNIKINNPKRLDTKIGIGSGFTFFDDGDELLVSAQKPLGILLEEREPSNENYNDRGTRSTSITLQDADIDTYAQCRHMGCRVSEVTQGGTADRAGVKEGDILVAVQNADVANASFEKVMERIIDAPKVVNLRFWRKESIALEASQSIITRFGLGINPKIRWKMSRRWCIQNLMLGCDVDPDVASFGRFRLRHFY
eukprot:scaffold3260_cov285-Chaetoceros_neogracile.AAC.4